MKWFVNLTTQTKLFVGFGLMIGLMAIVFATAFDSIRRIRDFQGKIFDEEFANVANLKDVRFNQHKIRTDTLTTVIVKDRSRLESLLRSGNEYTKKNDELMQKVLGHEKDAGHMAQLRAFDEVRKAFKETREKEILPLILAGKTGDAAKLITGIQAERNEKMSAIIDELVDGAEKEARAAVSESSQIARRSGYFLALISLAALLLGVFAARYLGRMIAGPLRQISGVAEQVSSGDLTVNLPEGDRRDEVGTLARTFRKMVENLREVNREIRESVNILASSASEILSTTSQVASGAAETATSVSETTTTVEEVKQTAQVSSQKAKYVSDSAQKAVQVSHAGGKSVEETIEKMNRIQDQMAAVAESIVSLSEQSQSIGEIIATVNDLAEQSNLLAVNAAIEATRAGEQGKGFGVVAQEIRSLAEQSKQATAQVRTILGEIQRATSAAVLATEQGSKAVEVGVKQSSQAGESIRTLAESITEAAQAAAQIAASSQQQLVGMEQVISAMDNIKLATEQNVSGTKQTETAAQNLHELGQKLKGLVEQYRV